MAQDQFALLDLLDTLRSAENGQLITRLLTHALQALIEAETTARIGAAPNERTAGRVTQRNGHRPGT